MHLVNEHIARIDWSEKKVLVACSGGLDSVVLAHALRQNNVPFVLLHVNYQLRGADSEADARFVQQVAAQLSVPFLKVVCPTEITTAEGVNLQNEARKFRRTLFDQWKAHSPNHLVALAHHQDDQIETFFLQYFRGSHLIGLSGMRKENNQTLRPLLELSKADLLDYATTNNLSWREDESNASNKYVRNLFRNQLLPTLRNSIGTLDESVLTLQQVFQATLEAETSTLPDWVGNTTVISQEQWHSLSETQQTLFLRTKGLPHWSLVRIEALFNSALSAAFEAGDFQVIRVGNGILFQHTDTTVRNWEFKVEEVKKLSKNTSNVVLYCSEDLLHEKPELRGAQPDDKIALPGLSGRKSVWKILKEQGIPAQLRGNQPVFCIKNEVIWVPGFAVSRHALVKNGSSSTVKITLIEKNEQSRL